MTTLWSKVLHCSANWIQMFGKKKWFLFKIIWLEQAVVSGGAGGALASLEFRSSVYPIQTEGADYVHHITASTPEFENLTTSLGSKISLIILKKAFYSTCSKSVVMLLGIDSICCHIACSIEVTTFWQKPAEITFYAIPLVLLLISKKNHCIWDDNVNQTPYWSALDFWKIEFEKSSKANWIFSRFRTGFLLPL